MYNFSREKILNSFTLYTCSTRKSIFPPNGLSAKWIFREVDFPRNGFSAIWISAKWTFRQMDFPRNGFSAIRIGAIRRLC